MQCTFIIHNISDEHIEIKLGIEVELLRFTGF